MARHIHTFTISRVGRQGEAGQKVGSTLALDQQELPEGPLKLPPEQLKQTGAKRRRPPSHCFPRATLLIAGHPRMRISKSSPQSRSNNNTAYSCLILHPRQHMNHVSPACRKIPFRHLKTADCVKYSKNIFLYHYFLIKAKVNFLFFSPTRATPPLLKVPNKISSASTSPISFMINLRSGLAP